ncbi:RnfH family protein [Rubrivivax sp. RP6-9]|uniref:RnfH family protein n=1 Tax=Rubrivivax sp. RP6-9 TaxID=3415750 RepID=UPI003CC5D74D
MARAETLPVEVVYCPQPGQVDQVRLQMTAGATLADALQASGLLQRHALVAEGLRMGIWGKLREPATPLRAHDRIEIYRPLTVDPKEARRLRYKRNKAPAATP